MTTVVRIKRRAANDPLGPGAPAPGTLMNAELAFNEVDNTLYYGSGEDANGNATAIIPIGGDGAGLPEAPSDTVTYGRKDVDWEPVLPLAGGAMTGLLTIDSVAGVAGTDGGTTAAGGNVDINAGDGTAGGRVRVYAGDGTTSGGGSVSVRGGQGTIGGGATLAAGKSTGVGNVGGNAAVTGGFVDTGTGGNVTITSGSASVSGNSGNVVLDTGTAIGGVRGDIRILNLSKTAPDTVADPMKVDTVWNNNGVLNIGAGGAGGDFLPLTGGVLTGPLTLENDGIIESQINGTRGGIDRWRLVLGNTSVEDGNDRGTDFAIARFADNGDPLGTALQIFRQTGQVQFSAPPLVNGVPIGSGEYLPLTGGVLTGTLELPAADAAVPLVPTQAVNKQWLDWKLAPPMPASGFGADVVIQASDSTGALGGGMVTLTGGESPIGIGGYVTLRAGSGGLIPGSIELHGAPGTVGLGVGGPISVTGGSGSSGGSIWLLGGDASGDQGLAGGIRIVGGTHTSATTLQQGGQIEITAGPSTGATSYGGSVAISGGEATASFGGDILIEGGVGALGNGSIRLANLRTTTGPTTGVIWNNNGALNIGAGITALPIDVPDGTEAPIERRVGGLMRWRVALGNNTPETPEGQGTDFTISRFGNDGSPIDSVINISRQSGVVDFKFPPTVEGAPLGGGGDFLPLTGGTMIGDIVLDGVNVTGKDAAAGSNASGAVSIFRGGAGDGGPMGWGGDAILEGGWGGAGSTGGGAQVIGGDSGTTAGNGGTVSITGGASVVGVGGPVMIRSGGSTSGRGGDINIRPGESPVGNGNITLQVAGGSGPAGTIALIGLPTVAQPVNGVWDNNGVLNIGAGGTAPITSVVTDGVSITGDGSAATPITLSQATQAVMGGGMISTAALLAAGADDVTFVSPLALRSQLGADAATLVTTAKTVVPGINEIYNTIAQLTGVVIYAGTYDATTSTGTYNGQGGIAAGTGALPAAAAANHGAYVMVTVAGPGGVAPEPAGPLAVGDWLISDGTAWSALKFGQAMAAYVAKAGDMMTGALSLPAAVWTTSLTPAQAVNKQWLDWKLDPPDSVILGPTTRLSGGGATGAGGSGGAVTVRGGAGGPGGLGGRIDITSGSSSGPTSSSILIQAGESTNATLPIAGGDVYIRGGVSVSNAASVGGNVILEPGQGAGAAWGDIIIPRLKTTAQAADVVWNNAGVLNIGAGGTSGGGISEAPDDTFSYGRMGDGAGAFTWEQVMPLTGGNLIGPVTTTSTLTLFADPVLALEAVTKQYADNIPIMDGGTY